LNSCNLGEYVYGSNISDDPLSGFLLAYLIYLIGIGSVSPNLCYDMGHLFRPSGFVDADKPDGSFLIVFFFYIYEI